MVNDRPEPNNFLLELVVTRHALSCANIVSEWKGSKYTGRNVGAQFTGTFAPNRMVADPILAAAGVQGSREMRVHIQKKIEQNNSGVDMPDAVLASELVRSIETAHLQYPAKQIHVVPWIREGGFKFGIGEGSDNLPLSTKQQINSLTSALALGEEGLPALEDKWMEDSHGERPVDLHGQDGNWGKFLDFLGNAFLPELIPTLHKPKGGKVTLAIVTHSNFMAKTPDLKHCSTLWEGNKGNKPLNNEAVKLTYFATDVNSTGKRFSFVQKPECMQVAPGMSYHGRELCMSDIGNACSTKLSEASVSLPITLDDKLKSLDTSIMDLKDKLARNAQDKLQYEYIRLMEEANHMLMQFCADGRYVRWHGEAISTM